MTRKITIFFLIVAISLGMIWYSSFDMDEYNPGLNSSVLSAQDVSCTDVAGKIQELTSEKNIINTQLEQIRTELRSLSGQKSGLDISKKQVEEEKARLTTFEHDFFKKTQFAHADELRASVQRITLNIVDLNERVAKSTNIIRNRLLNRKIRILENWHKKNSELLEQYTNALTTENMKVQDKEGENSRENNKLIQQIAQKENSRKNYEDALQQLASLQSQLNTKNTTCAQVVAQNTVSNADANSNSNTNATTNTSGSIDTNPTTNTVTPGNTTQANTTQETASASSGSGETANTSSGANATSSETSTESSVTTGTVSTPSTTSTVESGSAGTTLALNSADTPPVQENTGTANTNTPVSTVPTNTAQVVTTPSQTTETSTIPATQQTSPVVGEVNNQGAASAQTVIAQKENIGVVYSGLPGFTEFTEIRNPLKSLMVSNFNNKLINVEGGKVCWFSVKQVGNIQNIPFWIQQSWEGYKSIFLDQIYFYFDNKPTSNNEEPFSITTYIEKCINANNRISNDCWIESSNIKKRITEDRKYQISTSQVPFPGAWFQAKNVYFSYHANSPGIRTLSNGGSIFDRDFIFYGCVDKNEPVPKF